jgi:hypothetical protein
MNFLVFLYDFSSYGVAVNVLNNTNKSSSTRYNKSNNTFASITAYKKTPSKDQAIVFNSIDGIP